MKKFLSLLICIAVIAAGLYILKGYIADPNADPVSYITGETKPPTELTDIGSPYKFYYNRLSDIEKHTYNAILSEIYDMPESIDIPRVNALQLDDVFSALLYDNPDLFFVGRKCTLLTSVFGTSCSIDYIMDKEEYQKQKEELEKACSKVISSLSDPEDDWQTELEIHDYIVENCDYKIEENELVYSSAYGVLVNGLAACEGYSRAAKLLMDMAGVESAMLSGVSTNDDGTEGPHMWNAVKLGGEYYYLDCTWDDPVGDNGSGVKTYAYFNIDTQTISASHSKFSYDFECTATAENYYIKTGKYFENFDRSDEEKLASLIAKGLDSGEESIEIRFGSKDVYNDAVDDLIDNGRIYSVLSSADKKTDIKISLKSLVYYKDSGLLTLTVVPECS